MTPQRISPCTPPKTPLGISVVVFQVPAGILPRVPLELPLDIFDGIPPAIVAFFCHRSFHDGTLHAFQKLIQIFVQGILLSILTINSLENLLDIYFGTSSRNHAYWDPSKKFCCKSPRTPGGFPRAMPAEIAIL